MVGEIMRLEEQLRRKRSKVRPGTALLYSKPLQV